MEEKNSMYSQKTHQSGPSARNPHGKRHRPISNEIPAEKNT